MDRVEVIVGNMKANKRIVVDAQGVGQATEWILRTYGGVPITRVNLASDKVALYWYGSYERKQTLADTPRAMRAAKEGRR